LNNSWNYGALLSKLLLEDVTLIGLHVDLFVDIEIIAFVLLLIFDCARI